jgi:hypothetical protein
MLFILIIYLSWISASLQFKFPFLEKQKMSLESLINSRYIARSSALIPFLVVSTKYTGQLKMVLVHCKISIELI